MIYTVTFNPAIDYVVHTGGLVLGSVNRASSESMFFGGKGINVSLVLAELGVRSIALGFTAGFTGEAIENGVRAMGIETDFIRLPEGNSRINVKIKSGEETELNGQGPDIDTASLEKLFARLDGLSEGDTLILAGSIPKSLPADVYERILKRLSGREIRTVVDASGELLMNVLKYRPFLIKPNDQELGELFGLLEKESAATRIVFDYSLVSDTQYYNGVVFRGYLPGAAESVLAGGEYDGLMRRMGHRARGIGFALYLDRLEDRERERQWDVDVLLLCDRESDAAAIRAQVKELNDKGLSVSVQNAIPEKLRCREILDRRGEAARC